MGRGGARAFGRPTIPMERFVRLMVVKPRTGWGYETLVREVSDSLHLRRFCRIALSERVPDESTIRKLMRRLGPEVVEEITRAVIAKATTRETRFVARAVRIDSTVVEADIRYPTDAALARGRDAGAGARGAAGWPGWPATGARGCGTARARSAGKLREISRTVARRTGEAKPQVLRLTGEAGELVERSVARGAPARRRGCASARAAAARRPSWPPAARLERAGRARREGRAPDRPARSRARRSPTGWSR